MRPIDRQSAQQSLQCGRSFKAERPKKGFLRRYSSEITSEFVGCGTPRRSRSGQLSKAVALASVILFPLVAQADVMGDTVTFFDPDGTLSMLVTGPPRIFLKDRSVVMLNVL